MKVHVIYKCTRKGGPNRPTYEHAAYTGDIAVVEAECTRLIKSAVGETWFFWIETMDAKEV